MTYPVLFIYPVTVPYSGQTAATQLAMRELSARGWNCSELCIRGFDRSASKSLNLIYFTVRILSDWVRIALISIGSGHRAICFNHTQSLAGFLRMGLPHLILRLLFPKMFIVTSLHGNVFTTWDSKSWIMRLFLRILSSSNKITVLGQTQRSKLIELGIAPEKLVILPNTGDVDLMPTEIVRTKHKALINNPDTPIVLLHLSLIIESKGFMEYLEACEKIAHRNIGRPLEVLLCGPLVHSPYCTRLKTSKAKEEWIEKKIARLNAIPGVTASWLPGAVGQEKSCLFQRAHMFLFPSRYPVEAQPLVLMEAMAAGCCIVSSNQGEIPSTIGSNSGVCLEDVSPASLAAATETYILDHSARLSAAISGRNLVERDFCKEIYGQRWELLLKGRFRKESRRGNSP